jgi:hypothetical protein
MPNTPRKSKAQNTAISASLAADLAAIETQSLNQLRATWSARLGTDPPAIRSRDVLLGLLAWELQAEHLGGLDAASLRKLRQVADTLERDGIYAPQAIPRMAPGVILTREWKGVVQRVTVTTHGFRHGEKEYRSLSEVARAITSTRWSGPRFFGLEDASHRRSRSAHPRPEAQS